MTDALSRAGPRGEFRCQGLQGRCSTCPSILGIEGLKKRHGRPLGAIFYTTHVMIGIDEMGVSSFRGRPKICGFPFGFPSTRQPRRGTHKKRHPKLNVELFRTSRASCGSGSKKGTQNGTLANGTWTETCGPLVFFLPSLQSTRWFICFVDVTRPPRTNSTVAGESKDSMPSPLPKPPDPRVCSHVGGNEKAGGRGGRCVKPSYWAPDPMRPAPLPTPHDPIHTRCLAGAPLEVV